MWSTRCLSPPPQRLLKRSITAKALKAIKRQDHLKIDSHSPSRPWIGEVPQNCQNDDTAILTLPNIARLPIYTGLEEIRLFDVSENSAQYR
ncbi:unnamed protein product [Nesidiocoris tenuis]|uniref:Uncharacterized protein n=1 Tax=Nesidiocoris tenuis TaxID=355587 RepID=A0A6H5HJE9_9HEMI|nr:unnamed protein product [Nesidiocoris tenuis]CAB0017947.1 unnamed protein product [Nesidiocoris tenuis]